MNKKYYLAPILLLILACSALTPETATPTPGSIDSETPEIVRTFIPETHTPTRQPHLTHTPSATASATTVPTSTKAFITSPQPIEIEELRKGEYIGSDIFVESELEHGFNYSQYYVYYLSEGLKIYALLTIPDGDTPEGGFPVIIFNHGYIPPDDYRTTENYVNYIDALSRSGYVVFRIDYRGHDNSDGLARSAYGYADYTIDVLNAINTIKRHSQVNPEKIGMFGHSMGGFLTLRAMVISPQIKAGVIWAGVVAPYSDLLYNWPEYNTIPHQIDNGVDWRDRFLLDFGSPEQNPRFWNAISANSYLADLSGPLQLHHGTADAVVPVEFSRQLVVDSKKAGKSVDLYLYENDDHNLSVNFDLAMTRTIEFFDKTLK